MPLFEHARVERTAAFRADWPLASVAAKTLEHADAVEETWVEIFFV
jgi:hypothetical protein